MGVLRTPPPRVRQLKEEHMYINLTHLMVILPSWIVGLYLLNRMKRLIDRRKAQLEPARVATAKLG